MSRFTTSTAGSLSKGTTLSRSGPATAQTGSNKVFCSIYEGKSSVDVNVGLCFFNIATGEITLSTILDSQTYVRTIHKIHVFEPSDILAPEHYIGPPGNKLTVILKSNVSQEIRFHGVDKRFFNSNEGLENIQKLAFEKDLNYLKQELGDKQNALCALAAGMKFIIKIYRMQQVFFKKFRFKYEVPESTMFIDTRTIKSLQLTENLVEKNGLSFMKFLNSTLTKMGERVLRNNIFQPLTDKDSIIMRLEAVKELVDNQSLLDELRVSIKGLQDLDKIFAILLLSNNSEVPEKSVNKVNHIILVKQAVNVAIDIGNYLEGARCTLLQQIRDICKDDGVIAVKNLIDEYINEDCNWASGTLDIQNQRIYAVKSGKNGYLDMSRKAYNFVGEEAVTTAGNLSEQYDLFIEACYNNQRGYYLKVKNYEDINQLPDIFINRKEKKNFLECTTLDLIKWNARMDDTVSDILRTSDKMLEELLDEITNYIPVLFMMGEALAVLDLFQCFALNATKGKYSCPEISDMLTLKASRHPIVETMTEDYVSNDICAVKDTSRVQVITGTNMSGKSVYLRQVALLSIMAQIGSFVPAEYANFPIFNSLKARICVDNFASTTSSFATEMNEMGCILEDVDENSLVIIDELGRGSSLNDGFAISLAICEHLVTTNATVFITTHFHELSKILGTKPGVIQNHMSCSSTQNDGLKMNYRMLGGLTDVKRYGIRVAQKYFENSIIEKAKEISENLENNAIESNPEEEEQMVRNRKLLNLVKILEYVANSNEISKELLLGIQEEFLN